MQASAPTIVSHPTLPERLRAETMPLHLEIERVIGTPRTVAELARTLARFHGFVVPWERQIAAGIAPLRAELGEREKAHLLRADLLNLGLSQHEIDALPLCPGLPDVATTPAAMGSMYVLEGSTLGGQLLCRHVETTLGLNNLRGYSYYASYGSNVGVMWRQFRDLLMQIPHESADEVVRSAEATFRALCTWFGQSK